MTLPVLVSYPKSGRTWHRLLVGAYLCIVAERQLSDALHFTASTLGALDDPVLSYSHDGSSTANDYPSPGETPEPPVQWAGGRIIILTRSLPDVLVSYYQHLRYRRQIAVPALGDFVRSDFGAARVLKHYVRWHELSQETAAVLHLSYEAMHADAPTVLRNTLDFLGIAPHEEAVLAAAAFCEFENMQALERTKYFDSPIMRTADPAEPESMKVRRGKVGAAKEYLSAADITAIQSTEAALGNPFIG